MPIVLCLHKLISTSLAVSPRPKGEAGGLVSVKTCVALGLGSPDEYVAGSEFRNRWACMLAYPGARGVRGKPYASRADPGDGVGGNGRGAGDDDTMCEESEGEMGEEGKDACPLRVVRRVENRGHCRC
jgi:hypothetical protein